jgi:hypothetical protein
MVFGDFRILQLSLQQLTTLDYLVPPQWERKCVDSQEFYFYQETGKIYPVQFWNRPEMNNYFTVGIAEPKPFYTFASDTGD